MIEAKSHHEMNAKMQKHEHALRAACLRRVYRLKQFGGILKACTFWKQDNRKERAWIIEYSKSIQNITTENPRATTYTEQNNLNLVLLRID